MKELNQNEPKAPRKRTRVFRKNLNQNAVGEKKNKNLRRVRHNLRPLPELLQDGYSGNASCLLL